MKKYYINLEKRPDRMRRMEELFTALDWDVERFEAIDLQPGWVGCAESHVQILKSAVKAEQDVMILEDDVQFLFDPCDLDEIMEQLPPDWDLLYLGASPKEPQERYSENLFRLKNAHVTHAIIWHYKPFAAMEFVVDNNHKIEKFDDFLVEYVQPYYNCFVVFPMMATQFQSKSDIAQHSDTSTIERNFYEYCKP